MVFEMHEPVWTGTADTHDGLEDVTEATGEERFSSVADHYLLSASGFPPEEPSDLKLCVVDEELNLNRELLRSARRRLDELDELDAVPKAVVDDEIARLMTENFDDGGFE